MELDILHPYFTFDQIKTTLGTKQHMPGLTKNNWLWAHALFNKT